MVSVGLISKWHVHAGGYAQQLQDDPNVNIAAVWDEIPARGEEWATELGAPFFADYDAFLASDIQAVVCDSPTTMHTALLTKAAAAGKHIFTEKLLAADTAGAEAIAAAVKANGVIFTISLPCKCDPPVEYVRQLVEKGALGKVTGARFRRSHSGVSGNWLPAYWFDVAASGGGALMDLGAHPVYVLAELFGMPKRLSAMMTNLYGTSSDENTIALAEFEGGVLGTMETAFVTDGVPDLLEVYGTEGSVFVRGGEVAQALNADGGKMTPIASEDLPKSKPSPLAQFIAACEAGVPAPAQFGLEEAIFMTRMIEAAYRSEQSGKTIQF